MLSIRSSISLGILDVNVEITKLTKILISIPMVPIPSGEIPHNQFTEELSSGYINLK
jgi:hypothetical protein